MLTLHAAPTSDLSASFLDEVRRLLDVAFDGDFSDEDWRHALGGMHVWLMGPDRLIGHASVVERQFSCSGELLRVGYVEAVATVPPYRRKGHGTSVMARLGGLIQERYALGVLSSGAGAFYRTLGWEHWRGPTLVDAPGGRERTPDDDGGVMILRTPHSPHLDVEAEIVCAWRAGDVW